MVLNLPQLSSSQLRLSHHLALFYSRLSHKKKQIITTGYDEPGEDEEEDETAKLTRKPISEDLDGTVTEIAIQKKAAFILTNGQMPTANIGKSFDWKTKYHTFAVSDRLKQLNTDDKFSMIIGAQTADATSISEDYLKKIEPNTCSVIFYTNDCSKVNLATFRGKVGVINKDSQTIANNYANYFGQDDISDLHGYCPRAVFDSNLKKYVYSNSSCSSSADSNNHYYYYIYNQKQTDDIITYISLAQFMSEPATLQFHIWNSSIISTKTVKAEA